MNKMQILTAGFMEPLQAFARDFRNSTRLAQRSLRALAALSDCKMFPSVFGLQKLALFEDVLRCGDPPMVQASVVILFHLAILDAEFRGAILNMGLVSYVPLIFVCFCLFFVLFSTYALKTNTNTQPSNFLPSFFFFLFFYVQTRERIYREARREQSVESSVS
jgi:hypothetical protein